MRMAKFETVVGLLAMLRAAMREVECLPLSRLELLVDAISADPLDDDWQDVLLLQVLWFEAKARRDMGDAPARYAPVIAKLENGWCE